MEAWCRAVLFHAPKKFCMIKFNFFFVLIQIISLVTFHFVFSPLVALFDVF